MFVVVVVVVVVFVQSVSYRRTMNAIIPTLSETRN
jgi:septation ring formation regulator EzrA